MCEPCLIDLEAVAWLGECGGCGGCCPPQVTPFWTPRRVGKSPGWWAFYIQGARMVWAQKLCLHHLQWEPAVMYSWALDANARIRPSSDPNLWHPSAPPQLDCRVPMVVMTSGSAKYRSLLSPARERESNRLPVTGIIHSNTVMYCYILEMRSSDNIVQPNSEK